MPKKPLNKFAIALWILAVVYVTGEILLYFHFVHIGLEMAKNGKVLPYPEVLNAPPSVVLWGAEIAAFGMLIEIADKIRWLLERKAT